MPLRILLRAPHPLFESTQCALKPSSLTRGSLADAPAMILHVIKGAAEPLLHPVKLPLEAVDAFPALVDLRS